MEYGFSFGAEIENAAFLDNENIVVASSDEVVNEEVPASGLGPSKLGLWSIAEGCWRSTADLSGPIGTIMPWRDWAISFHEHPKAIEIATGKIAHRWDTIDSGKQNGSIALGDPPPPPIALNPQNGRFAIFGPEGISVVSLARD